VERGVDVRILDFIFEEKRIAFEPTTQRKK
jgi:hypothetical protein